MKQIILHVGMPKTGTSAIQESLYHGLSDPGFRYIGLTGAKGGVVMATVFDDTPENFHAHRRMGRSARQVQQLGSQWRDQLDNMLAAAGAEVRPILSGESCWGMSQMAFERIRLFMAERGYAVHIIAYVRPWKQWLESSFQQRVKMGERTFQIAPPQKARLDYRARIETLDAVFGAEQVRFYLYDRSLFPARCVVRHFCQQVGIHLDPDSIRHANDSLKLPAVQLLYAYRKFGPEYGTGAVAVWEHERLNRRLWEVRGPELRFHSSAVEPVIREYLPQASWLEQRLGHPFTENWTQHDHDVCIRTEADLFDFDPEALAWLATAVGGRPVRPGTGEAAARAVAAQMHALRRNVPPGLRIRWLVHERRSQAAALVGSVRGIAWSRWWR